MKEEFNINNIKMMNQIGRDEFSKLITERGTDRYKRLAEIIGSLDVLIQSENKRLKKGKQMKILELFSGTESFSKVARERGHQTFTVDFDKSFNPNLCIDILDFDISMLPEEFRHPDIIWASPPCQKFSVMTVYKNWIKKDFGYLPKTKEAMKSCFFVYKTLNIIKQLNPKYFIIENPRGMLRKQEMMNELKRNTVTYCKYGLEYQKATDLWNNLENWKPKEICKPNSPCHIRAPRGSRLGIQSDMNGFRKNRPNQKHKDISMLNHPNWDYAVSRSPVQRAIVPKELCLELIKCCENQDNVTL